MSGKSILSFDNLKNFVQKSSEQMENGDLKSKIAEAGELVGSKADEIKNAAMETKENIDSKLKELDHMLEQAVTDYNDAYTLMNDKGMKLYVERCRAADSLDFVESLINSIANHPKSFDADFTMINTNRQKFTETCDFADREIQEARKSATRAGVGLAAGASVAMMAPSAAMWIATTFGTASTGAAISTLSGAAAQNAALAWLGGGAVAAGGGGMTAGNALLAMAGPVGWTIAGATVLSSIVICSKKKMKMDKEKSDEIESVRKNTAEVRKMDAQIAEILNRTNLIRLGLNQDYKHCLKLFNQDYSDFTRADKMELASLVNNAKSLSQMFSKTIE